MRVLLNPTFSTTPVTEPTVTISPTVKGWSKKIVKEPKRFSKLSLEAIARASPPIPRPVASAVIFTSKIFPITITKANTYVIIFAISIIKGIS